MGYGRVHNLGLVSLCAHNRIKAKRKELYQNLVCLHSDTARLLHLFLLYPKIYNCLQRIDNFQLLLQESNTLCFSTFRNQNRVAL